MALYKMLGIKDVMLGIKVAGTPDTIVDYQFTFANAFQINPQNQEITFQGDGQQEYVSLNLGMRGTMAADKFNTDVMEKVIGAAPVTTGLTGEWVGITKVWFPEGGAYPNVRARVKIHAIDDSTGSDVYFRLEIFKVQIYPRPWVPGNIATAAKQPMELAWTALKSSVDLIANAIPGVPTGGAFYALQLLT